MMQILRNTAPIATVTIDEQTVYSGELMGADKIESVFDLPPGYLPSINDYTLYDGRPYKIRHATGLEEATGRCVATFYGLIYDLYDVPMSHLGRTRFSYTGTPLQLLGLLVDCLNAWFGGGWSVGDVEPIAEPVTFVFDEVSCRQALTDIAETFKLEWRLVGKTIHMVERVGVLHPLTLKYGRGQGLQLISRESVDSSFATAWKFYGGSRNLPAGYRSGMDRITPQNDGVYFETNVALYGRKGGSVTFEDVYPQRTAEVETTPDINTITDSTIDFDINNMFITDGGAKIVFKTGPLGGNEFTITSYDHSTKTIRFGTNKDEDTGYLLPNDTRYAEPGDTYTIVGIEMPPEYVAAAEAEVEARGEAHALQHNHPPVKFPLVIDEKYIREMGLAFAFKPGDSFRVKSESLGVDGPLRLQSVSWPLVNPCLIEGDISDILLYTAQQAMSKDVKQNRRITSQVQRTANYTRRVADEIANYAIINQFKKTYVGERAVMTGAFVAGNPEDGEVAGINGTGSELDEVRFWAGESFANRESAPFRVQQNGNMFSTAGYIGGFKILPGSLESANEYSGGKFVLYPDDGFIAFIDNAKGIWSGMGVNTLSSVLGIRAVGRFENKEVNELGTNYSALMFSEGARNNIALYAAGNASIAGALSSTKYYRFTPDDEVNTLSAATANIAMVLVDNASYDTVYLPLENDITRAFGIGITADFIVRYTVYGHYDSLDFMLTSDYDMRDSDGALISFVTIAKGDATEWIIYRESGVVTAQLANRQS